MDKDQISATYRATFRESHGRRVLRTDATRCALVVGGSKPGSIGAAIARVLKERGFARVLVPTEGELDVVLPHMVEGYFFAYPNIDTVIACQAVTHLDWIEDQDYSVIERIVDVTLNGSMYLTRAFVEASIDAPYRKQIVFIGSMAYTKVLNGSAPYCAAKAGLAHFAKCAAWELAPKGYDVFCIHPSNVQGAPMTEETIRGLMRYRGLTREEATAYWDAGRVQPWALTPEEVAAVVSDCLWIEARYLVGGNIELNGGGR